MPDTNSFSFENINKSRKETLLKSFSNELNEFNNSDIDQEISKAIELDVIEKGRKGATIGEIREWSGKKYQKTAQGWKPYKGKGDGAESLKDGDVDVTGQKDTPIPKEDKKEDENIVNKELEIFKKIAKESKDVDDFIIKVREHGAVDMKTYDHFHKEYGEGGKLTIKQAAQKLFDEAHAEKKTVIKDDDKEKIAEGFKNKDGMSISNDPKTREAVAQHAKEHLKKLQEGKKGSNVWTEDQQSNVDKLDQEFEKYLKEKNIDPNSKEASDAWREGGFKDKMKNIFSKDDKPKDIKKQHKDLLDKKDYVGASKLLVDTYGTDEEKKKINDFIEADKKGETTEAGYKEFDSIVQKYSKEVEKKPRKPRTKKADMIIKEGNVKTKYPDIDFDKLPKEVADDFAEKLQDANTTMDDFIGAATGKYPDGTTRQPSRFDPELSDEQIKALKELDKKDLEGVDKIKEFDKIVKDEYSYDSDQDNIKNALNAHKEIKEKYPDASTTKDKDQLRLFKSLNEAKKDHISKSILGY